MVKLGKAGHYFTTKNTKKHEKIERAKHKLNAEGKKNIPILQFMKKKGYFIRNKAKYFEYIIFVIYLYTM